MLGRPVISLFLFQSTPPVKAATSENSFSLVTVVTISIHAAREGGDAGEHAPADAEVVFQSTPPVKAATGTD